MAVVGGGDTACEEALYLASLAKKVYMIVRKPFLRAAEIMQQRVKGKGEHQDTLRNQHHGTLWRQRCRGCPPGTSSRRTQRGGLDIAIDGFFLAIGHKPNTELFKGHIDLDEQGFIKVVPGTATTNLPGIFVCR